jgi:ParB-like nuclease domain
MADLARVPEELWPASGQIEKWDIARVLPYAGNPKEHTREQIEIVKNLIISLGWTFPILVDERGEIIAGHCRCLAAAELGLIRVPVIVARGWTEAQKKAARISDNASSEPTLAPWNIQLLKVEIGDLKALDFPLHLTAFPEIRLQEFGFGGDGQPPAQPSNGTLAEQFGVPPFSVLNARSGWWQVRKAAWIALGMQPELGRGEAPKTTGGGSVMPAVDYSKSGGGL